MRFKFTNLSFIYMQITINTVTIQTQTKFYLCFAKFSTNVFSDAPTPSLMPSVGPSSNTFFDYQCKIMKYYQHPKLQHV